MNEDSFTEGTLFCRVQGGLGNQLFQLANVIALAADNKREFKLYEIEESKSIFKPRKVYWQSLLKHLKSHLINPDLVISAFPLQEQSFNYCNITLPPPFFHLEVTGYFQSHKYFHQYRSELLEKFLPIDLCNEAEYKLKQLNDLSANPKARTVSLHIRRGDYLQLSDTHIVQDLAYYQAALTHLGDEPSNYFIFSDDLNWCIDHLSELFINHSISRLNFCSTNQAIVSTNTSSIESKHSAIVPESLQTGENLPIPLSSAPSSFRAGPHHIWLITEANDVMEFLMMRICQCQIIANSSFSWWAAYLNPRQSAEQPDNDFKVIAPKHWFGPNGPQKHSLYLPDWIIL